MPVEENLMQAILLTFGTAMVPVLELRGAIPVGVAAGLSLSFTQEQVDRIFFAAAMAILLASDASSYMTGQAYHIDGGCLCGGAPWDYDTQYKT